MAKLFLDIIYKLHGLPVNIVSDRDKVFTSLFWGELFKLLGTKLSLSSAYHPQSDGQTERLNQCLEQYLRCMVHSHPKQWLKWLPMAEFWYNTNYHSSLKMTPFQALYGYQPPTHSLGPYLDSNNIEVKELLQQRQLITEHIKDNLKKAQERMKFYADKHRQERSFEVGDMVFLKLQPFRQNSVHLRKNLKLSSRYFGPYKVLEKVGSVAYRLELPPESKIFPIFHVSLLKKQIGKKIIPSQILPATDESGIMLAQAAKVMEHRQILEKGRTKWQVKILWKEEDWRVESWEDTSYIFKLFPTINPWGQGFSVPGGIVTSTLVAEPLKVEEESGNRESVDQIRDEVELVDVFGLIDNEEVQQINPTVEMKHEF